MQSLNIHKDEAARLGDRVQQELHDIEKTIALALTVLVAAFAVGPAKAGGDLTAGQRWFIFLLPLLVFALLMLGVNRMTALLAMGGVRRWHEDQVNTAFAREGRTNVLPWEGSVAVVERYDRAGYFVFSVMPAMVLAGSMGAAFTMAAHVRLYLALLTLVPFAGMLTYTGLALSYMSKAPDRAFRLASGEKVEIRPFPFMAPIAGADSQEAED